jgi:hypothetical protein
VDPAASRTPAVEPYDERGAVEGARETDPEGTNAGDSRTTYDEAKRDWIDVEQESVGAICSDLVEDPSRERRGVYPDLDRQRGG